MSGMTRKSHMMKFINYRVRVNITDTRYLIGKFMAFDRHMNMVLGDCDEFRKVAVRQQKSGGDTTSSSADEKSAADAAAGGAKEGKKEVEIKRVLGLVLLRGENIVSLSIEGPPPSDEAMRTRAKPTAPGQGMGRPAGRGMPMMNAAMAAPQGLSGPVRGVGGPASAAITPMGGRGMPVAPVAAGGMGMGRGMMPMGGVAPAMGRGMMPMGGAPAMGRGAPMGMPPMGMGMGMQPMGGMGMPQGGGRGMPMGGPPAMGGRGMPMGRGQGQ